VLISQEFINNGGFLDSLTASGLVQFSPMDCEARQ